MAAAIDTILQGVLLGGLYALFATGLSLSFGIMRMVNVAHGDLIILASYLAWVTVATLGMNAFAAALVVVPAMTVVGYGLQRYVLNPVLSDDPLPPLLVTFGLSVIIQNLLLEGFSADARGIDAGVIETASLALGGDLAVGWLPLLVFASAVAVIAGLELLLSRTPLGRAFRATSDDQTVAQLMGIDNRHLYAVAMALACAVTGIAGIYLAIRTTFGPMMGPSQLLFAFEAVIIGGMGSLWGTLAGGVLLGVSQSIGFRLDPGWGILTGHLAFLAVLVMRPQGLFARTRDA
ncbi:MAG: branched-chain amino acid ABC transporter permease [Rhodospirillales bacterium]|nr:branched-chain amino acid ABC transporter permease [Rhodospirillales bacterium]